MIKLQAYITTFICLLILQSCSYNTQSQNTTPYFDGVIKFNGEAVINSRVILSLENADTACLKPARTAQTDEDGKFSIKAITEQKKYTPFVNYAYQEWNLCVVYKDNRYLLYSNNRYDSGNVVSSIYLECELTARRNKSYCKPVQ